MNVKFVRNTVDVTKFRPAAVLPYELRVQDFQMAMQDVYDFFFDVNSYLTKKGLERLDDMLRPAIMSRKAGGAVDTDGAREQWLCVFVYDVDTESEPARQRRPMAFKEVYLGKVMIADFRRNARGELGTRTATLHKEGIQKLRRNWVYRL
jgi:hypothetical protein